MRKPPVVERVEKLLRLASPRSGTTEHERASAALEVVRLIEDHDLIVRERKAEPVRKTRRREEKTEARAWSAAERAPAEQPRPAPSTPPPGSWVQSMARHEARCADEDCGQVIGVGEPVWMRISGYATEYLHFDGPCGW